MTDFDVAGVVLDALRCYIGAELVDALGLDSPFVDDLGLGRLDVVDILATIDGRIEARLGAHVLTRELSSRTFTTVRDLIEVVEQAVARDAEERRIAAAIVA